MVPSIYDYRDHEIELHRRIRRERIARTIEAAVCAPLLVASLLALIFI